jgi:NAD(P)-dependent dehydrogenase (short-subunit alcohol dehydrogenase family)
MGYWHGKVALVTGASGGLGLAIANAFVDAGARVVLAARGAEALEAAAAQLCATGGEVLAVPTDVTDSEQVQQLVARTVAHFGQLDVLVNNAGRSMRKPVLDTTPDEFEAMLEINFLAAVRMVQACLPHVQATGGHLVNIGSLAGKAPARWIGAYPASKFALTAYTQQLRLEMAEQTPPRGVERVNVLLVCPGPIARQSPREEPRYQASGVPEHALKPGAGVRTSAIDPNWLARKILAACEGRRAELIVPRIARVLFVLMQMSPRLADWLVRKTT